MTWNTPNCLTNSDELSQFFVRFCFVCKKMARYPRTFCNLPVSNRLLRFYHILSAVAAVEAPVAAAVAAAQPQQQEQYTAEVHICRALHLSRRRAGCRQGLIVHRNMPCFLAWCAVSADIIINNTIIISNCQHSLIFRAARNCEHIRDVWLASLGTVIAAWNRSGTMIPA